MVSESASKYQFDIDPMAKVEDLPVDPFFLNVTFLTFNTDSFGDGLSFSIVRTTSRPTISLEISCSVIPSTFFVPMHFPRRRTV